MPLRNRNMNQGPNRVAQTRNNASMQRPGTPFSAGRSQGQNLARGNQQQCPQGSKPGVNPSTGAPTCVPDVANKLGARLGRAGGQRNSSGPVIGSGGNRGQRRY